MLQDAPTPLSVSVERVVLAPGPLPLEATSPFVYFPQDALLSLVQAHPAHDAVDVAVVGRHACVGPSELWGAPMQAVVLVPGHACRLDWSQVKQDPTLYGPWLWHATAVTHGLIEQMAQTAFCMRHHNATQRLASWLLISLAQYGGASLSLAMDVLPVSMRQPAQALQDALSALQDQQAIQVQDGVVHVIDAACLAGVACRCHTMVKPSVAERQPQPL